MVNGTPDEHRFLNRVLYEWEFYMDKAEDSRPDFPIGSAAAHEVDGESNFVKVCQQQEPHVRALARMVGTKTWLTELVLWILAQVDEKGQDAIKPEDLLERVTDVAARLPHGRRRCSTVPTAKAGKLRGTSMPEDTNGTPDWLKTPDETTYCLTMYDGSGGSAQEVDITRAEFIALKRHLCDLRGISVPENIGAEE